ncbi:MAG TPA: Vms1/Ankzf1 family peptidyl-tRNA hydrolase [Acidimicrobiales bacterium]|nr:Vms1/Ankzf1 family peptidyl-tRNA hydrolase [Acidimicrobiales bacterium]
MERSGLTPQAAADTSDLVDLVKAVGPFLSLRLTTEAGIDNAARRSEQRWRALRDDAAAQGAPVEVLDAVDPLVADAHLQGEGLAVVASAGGVLHVEHGQRVPERDLARWAALPSLLPVVEWRQQFPAYVTVLADREGADLTAYRREGPDIHREAGGDDHPLRKPSPGGWSQRRYQERAEHTWERNAADAADQVVRLVRRVDARVVAAAGDQRALTLLEEALPADLAERLVIVSGGRSADGSEDLFQQEARLAVEVAVNADADALLEKFREERGQDDRAAEGARAVFAALAQAAVDVLLVAADDPDDVRMAWFGPEPTQLGTTAAEVRALGVDAPAEGRLVDVAVRAALGTGAGIHVVPASRAGSHVAGAGAGLEGGIGAILRWSA